MARAKLWTTPLAPVMACMSLTLCWPARAAKSREGRLSVTPVIMVRAEEYRQYVRVALANESDQEICIRTSTDKREISDLTVALYVNGRLLRPDTDRGSRLPPEDDEIMRLKPGEWVIDSAMRRYKGKIPPGVYEGRAIFHHEHPLGPRWPDVTSELSETWFLVEVVDEIPRDRPPMLRGTRKQFRGGFAMDAEPLWIDAPGGLAAGERTFAKPDREHTPDEVRAVAPARVVPLWAFCGVLVYAALASAAVPWLLMRRKRKAS